MARTTNFNSHARVGRDGDVPVPDLRCINFNSHARVGRDQSGARLRHVKMNFNSHARVGRDSALLAAAHLQMNFNSHARVGRDGGRGFARNVERISTHTPAWGVTWIVPAPSQMRSRFQLTRPRGA